MKKITRWIRYGLYAAAGCVVLGVLCAGVAYWLIAPRLPSVETLKDVRMQVPLRVYSADARLIATFGETRRIPVRIDKVPTRLKQAFLAAEDANFYEHGGVDLPGTLRAVLHVIFSGGEKTQGGSTITQQVARNFFLSPEKSYTRKLSEMFLALRIENALSKDEIFELYLNKIFLGHRSYGVAAAAEFYYGKTLDELDVAECAMLASLPKFPSTGNPLYNRERAETRRNYVLGRMLDNEFIDEDAYRASVAEADVASAHEPPIEVEAPYLAELVRREAIERFGDEALNDGYSIHTTIDSRAQEAGNRALRSGLLEYDRRHGYRGAEAHIDLASTTKQPQELLAGYYPLGGLLPGLVTDAGAERAIVRLADGQSIELDLEAVAWARPYLSENRRGATPKKVDEVLKAGDIVRVVRDDEETWHLAEIPAAQGALVALNPENGAIEALVGGFSFLRSKFNRVTQSARGPGSGFKPFLYAAAFDHGFTPASIVNDAPLVFPDPSKPNGLWMPQNDDNKFRGPMRLREALVKSVNLVSVRLLDAIGVHYAREYATRFGFNLDQIPNNLSMALGTASVSPLDMARGFAVFANGGFLVDPWFVETIVDRDGNTVFTAQPALACRDCAERTADAIAEPAVTAVSVRGLAPIGRAGAAGTPPDQTVLAPRAIDPRTVYLVDSLMRDVVRRGTGSKAMVLQRKDLAGKTGTTNEHRDAWFTGFNSRLVASTWVGMDDFSSLGRGEFGSQAALPIWIDFMRVALEGVPEQPFDMPAGISTVRVDPDTGLLASAADDDAILEVLKSEDVARLATQPRQAEDDAQRDAYDVF
jgi:penicillin-binding protein 1A